MLLCSPLPREHFFFKKLSFDFQVLQCSFKAESFLVSTVRVLQALKAQTLPPPIARPFQQRQVAAACPRSKVTASFLLRENAVCGMEDLSGWRAVCSLDLSH